MIDDVAPQIDPVARLGAYEGPFVEDLFGAVASDAALKARYAVDPWAHVDDGHVRVLNMETNKTVRWVPTDQQREMGNAWIDVDHLKATGELIWRNVHEEKTRQIGATTVLAWILLWALMYHESQGFVMNVKSKAIDDGGAASTYMSIFGKIRFMSEQGVKGNPNGVTTFWPDHLRPGKYLRFRQQPSMIINRNRETSYILGGEQSPDPARGGTFTHGLIDEAARLAWGEAVHASIGLAIPDGRFYNSTPNGKGNVYYRLRKERPANYIFLRHHWTQHPFYSEGMHVAGAETKSCPLCVGNALGLKWSPSEPVAHRFPGRPTSPWYDAAVIDLTDEQVAAELEIDYEGSLSARVFSEFSEAVHAVPEIAYTPHVPVEFGIDYGWGASATWVNIYQRLPTELHQIGEVVIMQGTPEQVCAALVDELADLGVPLLELEPTFTRELRMIGDPAAEGPLVTGGSLSGEYRKLGWNPYPCSIDGPGSVAVTINAVKRILLGQPVRFYISQARCPRTIEAFQENRWETDRTGKIKDNAQKPLNNVVNDGMRATAYYIAQMYPPPTIDAALSQATTGGDRSSVLPPSTDRSGRIDPGIRPDMSF